MPLANYGSYWIIPRNIKDFLQLCGQHGEKLSGYIFWGLVGDETLYNLDGYHRSGTRLLDICLDSCQHQHHGTQTQPVYAYM